MSHNASSGNATAPDARNAAHALMFGTVAALGLPLNAVSLWILLRRHRLKSPAAVFMVNLALSDLLLVVSLPLRVYFYATGTWPLGRLACSAVRLFFRANVRSGALFITFISLDRLLAVVYPLRTRHVRTAANAWWAAAFPWLFVLAFNVAESLGPTGASLRGGADGSRCFAVDPRPAPLLGSYAHAALVLALLAVNVACTALVLRTLRNRRRGAAVPNKVNVMLIFGVNLAMFAAFFLPVSLVVFFPSWRPYFAELVGLASVNCCLDPLLYYFSLDGFWRKKERRALTRSLT